MSRLTTVQTNFTAGELSPRLWGRTDIDGYQNGAERLENALPLIHGGVRNHYGSYYVAPAKNANKKARLIPFVYSTTAAYVIELGDLYMRVYKDNAQVLSAPLTPFEIATPYTEAQLFDIDHVQGQDTMFVFHPASVIYRIRRFADASWTADAAPFSVTPVDEVGDQFAVALTLSAATVGAGRTVTAAAPVFLDADVGRTIDYQGGSLTITAFTDTQHVTGTITTPFSTTALPASQWTLTGSPLTTITPNVATPFGAAVTLTASTNAWRNSDINKWVAVNDGLVQITGYTSATIVTGVIQSVLTNTTAAPANAWILKAPMWTATNGYPSCGTLYQQRLVVGGSTAFPQTIWGTATGLYYDFTLDVNDDDGFQYTLTSDQRNPISHLVSGKALLALTYGGEFTIKGGVEKPITPSNVQVDSETVYGSGRIKPLRVGKTVVFAQRSNTKLRAMKYYAADDSYDAVDLTARSEHITGTGIVDMSFQQETDPILWSPRADGQMATASWSEEQKVLSWARRVTDGFYESVATIPTATGDQTWALVKRTLGNGTVVRYVERFDSSIIMDCAISGTSGPGAAIWAGLGHLEGKTVCCIADGAYMGTFVVAGGSITLPRTAKAVTIGLPFVSTIKMLNPEVVTGTGTAQGNAMSTHGVVVRVLNTSQLKCNGTVIPFRSFGSDLIDKPPPVFTGLKKIENFESGENEFQSPLTFTCDVPLPFHLQAVIRQFTVNSGGTQ